jgi:hypothetical protein
MTKACSLEALCCLWFLLVGLLLGLPEILWAVACRGQCEIRQSWNQVGIDGMMWNVWICLGKDLNMTDSLIENLTPARSFMSYTDPSTSSDSNVDSTERHRIRTNQNQTPLQNFFLAAAQAKNTAAMLKRSWSSEVLIPLWRVCEVCEDYDGPGVVWHFRPKMHKTFPMKSNGVNGPRQLFGRLSLVLEIAVSNNPKQWYELCKKCPKNI